MESKRHLIALDLDGTLLTNKKDVSTFTRNVLQQARRLGHIVVIATGRSHLMSNYYYDLLDLNTPMINYNGSYIHHPKDQAWDRRVHHPVPIKIALKIVDACYELGVQNLWVESGRSEEHTSELQSRGHLVCRLLLEKKKEKSSQRSARKTNEVH